MDTSIDELTADHARALILSNDRNVREKFLNHFSDDIARASVALAQAHSDLQRLSKELALEERTATVHLFFHAAINAVLSSMHHLVSGYPIAAGHMMRHFTESVAMALMCADPATGVYDAYAKDRKNFPVHKAPERLRKHKVRAALKKSIDFDAEGWETIMAINELYDQLSHASALALGHQMMFTEAGGLIVGSEFDPAKMGEYASDMRRRSTAAESLAQIIPLVLAILPTKAAPGAA